MEHSASRRRFLSRVSVLAGTIALSGSPLVAVAVEEGESLVWHGRRRWIAPGRRFFPQSVASFDPRPESVLLWARLQDDDHAGQDLDLVLLVAGDPWLRRLVVAIDVTAHAGDDGVVQVKLTGLQPHTRYYYRFAYEKSGRWYGSALGRTRTAPAAQDSTSIRFALANCQNAIGRYYNSYFPLLAQDVDFVAHVGDYIYETTGDPSSQNTSGRGLTFSDTAGAIALQDGAGNTFFAAASMSNYRELYRFYRSDPVLQRVHERFPFINVWDDHEYSDDCWGATATYRDGRKNEFDAARRRNAERAFFEYVAIDDGSLSTGEVDLSGRPLYPDARLYRDFRFGRNLHLIVADYRSFRPDHLIAEDAFPGTIAVDRAALTALLGAQGIPYDAVKASFAPYIDLDSPPLGLGPLFNAYRAVLTGVLTAAYLGEGLPALEAAAKAAGNIAGKLDATVVNTLLSRYNALPTTDPKVPLIHDMLLATLDRGISYALMGKGALFSSLGARYFVVQPTFDLYAAYRSLLLQDPNAENAYGSEQLVWLQSALASSDARWKIVANPTSLTPMVLDLTGQAPGLPQALRDLLAQLPPLLRNRFYLNVDQFDGFPNFKRRLLELYGEKSGVGLIAGDIHAAFVNEHGGGVWEFTGPAVFSFAFRAGVARVVASDPALSQIPGLAALLAQLDALLLAGNPQMRYADTGVNGVVVLEASAAKLAATYYQIDGAEATTSYYERPWKLIGKLRTKRIEVAAAGMGMAGVGAAAAA